MDDEAAIRVTAILCFTFLFTVCAMVFGIGYFHGGANTILQARTAEKQEVALARVKLCATVPVEKRAGCESVVLHGPSPTSAVREWLTTSNLVNRALGFCGGMSWNRTIQCLNTVLTSPMAKSLNVANIKGLP